MAITRQASRQQLVPIIFGQHAVAGSQTDVQLPIAIGEKDAAVDGTVAPFAGRIVAVAASTSAAATAGSLTVGATINGTEDADTRLTVTTQVDKYLTIGRGKARFAAGDRIGCEITTTSAWDAITEHLSATVYVLYDMDGI